MSQRSVFTVIAVLAFGLIPSGVAFANGGPHGGFTPSTDACASCHRTNSAIGNGPLVIQDTYTLCMSCHGNGMGANTNVADGIYLSSRDGLGANENVGAAKTPDGAALLGGGFVTYKSMPVTSAHDPMGTATEAWGNGTPRGKRSGLAGGALSCTSCHDPHGSNNYRMLKTTVNGHAVSVAQVDEEEAKDYDTEGWGTGTSTLCSACHSAYHVSTAGSGSEDALVATGGYAHRVNMPYHYGDNENPETVGYGGYTLPLAQSGSSDLVVCMTCHLPHGTSAQMTGHADGGSGSALLRLDNRGVCQVCHRK